MTHITLPLIEGKPIKALIRGPKNKVIRNYNRVLVENTRLALAADQVTAKLGDLNEALKKAQDSDTQTYLQAQVEEEFAKIEAIHEQQMFIPYKQLLTIVELPEIVVDGVTRKATQGDIDWDEMDRGTCQEALDFFTASLSGRQPKSND